MTANVCHQCHLESLSLSDIYVETNRVVPGLPNADLADLTKDDLLTSLSASLRKGRSKDATQWTVAMIQGLHKARHHDIPSEHKTPKAKLVQYTMDWVNSLSEEEFGAEVDHMLDGIEVHSGPVESVSALPPSLWVNRDGSTRHFDSIYALCTQLSLCTGRVWTRPRGEFQEETNKLTSSTDTHTCTLKMNTRGKRVSLARLSPVTCTHTESPFPIGPDAEVPPCVVHVPFPRPVMSTSNTTTTLSSRQIPPLSDCIQVGEGEVLGLGVGMTHAKLGDNGLEVTYLPVPGPMKAEGYPKAMCRILDSVYVFGTFPDSQEEEKKKWRGRAKTSIPTLSNRLYQMSIDSQEWTEVQKGQGFPHHPVSARRTERGREFTGTLLMFNLDLELYVLLHTPELKANTTVIREPTTTLHRLGDVQNRLGAQTWTQIEGYAVPPHKCNHSIAVGGMLCATEARAPFGFIDLLRRNGAMDVPMGQEERDEMLGLFMEQLDAARENAGPTISQYDPVADEWVPWPQALSSG
ncbi:hypothetical protein KIPB_003737 [Kipferlia bialata]|uniref:Uncharacterized protein n=1 Tax=Kipferlia bialata TaxID=797122 RepID=A0A9K3GHH3_9EUKA|nr:hypothetical protein KIPB_003737 [Kipferlia bialata]|eukprot:g3737.t1